MKTRIAPLLLPLLLAGCGGPSVLPEQKVSPLVWSSMTYAGKDGPILVEAVGGPGGQPGGGLGPLVADYMTGAVIGFPASFTADPTRAPRPNFRTVMVFNPAPSLSEDEACAGDVALLAGQPPGRVTVFAAFCNGARALTWARGAVEGVTGPTHPAFVGLVRQTTTSLFRPAREDSLIGDPAGFP